MVTKKIYSAISLLSLSLALTACGGGDSSSTPTLITIPNIAPTAATTSSPTTPSSNIASTIKLTRVLNSFQGSMPLPGKFQVITTVAAVDINKDGQSLRIFPQSSSGSARIQLQNSGSGGLAGANAIIAVESSTGADQFSGTSPFSLVIGTATQKAFHLGANSAVVMTITGSSVGIGTTNPTEILEVSGSIRALQATNDKFQRRFTAIEQMAKQQGKSLKEMSLADMDELWDLVKSKE